MFWRLSSNSITAIRKVIVSAKPSVLIAGLIIALLSPTFVTIRIAHADTDCTPGPTPPPANIELSGSSWLSGGGVNVCWNGGTSTNDYGDSCFTKSGGVGGENCGSGTVYAGEEWQCVELVNRLYLTKGWTTATWKGNGNTLVNNVPSGLTKQNNGSISYVSPGDVITLDDGGLGHAAIINTIDSDGTVHIKNQNTHLSSDIDSSAYIDNGGSLNGGNAHYHMSGGWGSIYTVQAFVHHPGSVSPLTDKPALLKYNTEFDVFKRGSDNNIYKTTWGGSGWSGFGPVGGGSYASNPAAVKYGSEMDVFAVGLDGKVWKDSYNNGWGGFTAETPTGFTGDPAAVQYGNDMHMYVRGTDNRFYVKDWSPTANWFGLVPGGGTFVSNPTVVKYGSELDVFGIGADGKVWKNTYNGSSWSGPTAESSSGYQGNLAALQYGSGEMDVIARGTDNQYYKKTWTATGNSAFTLLPSGIAFESDPAVLQFYTEYDVFGAGTDHQIYKDTWGGSGWSGFGPIAGSATTQGNPAALQYNTEMDVVVMKNDNIEYKNSYTYTNGWQGFGPLY